MSSPRRGAQTRQSRAARTPASPAVEVRASPSQTRSPIRSRGASSTTVAPPPQTTITKDAVLDVLRGLSVDELACILPDSFQSSRILSSVQKETRSDELWKLVQNLFLDLLDDDMHSRLLELDAADEISTASSDFWSSVFSSVLPGKDLYKPDLREFPWDPMVDFRPKAVPPEVQRQLKFKPQLQAKEDTLKSVLDKQMRPLARLMLHLSKMAVSKVPDGPDKIEANLRHMMKLTELVSQRFWISLSEVVQARKSVGFQVLGMTEAESSKTDSYLNEADLLRIKEVVKH